MGASNDDDTTKNSAVVVIKAAKKTLKRQESGSMKIKQLTKTLLTKFESDNSVPSCKSTVKKWIEESDVFDVDGKVVTLKKGSGSSGSSSKKRKSISSSVEEDGADNGSGGAGSSSSGDIDKKAAKKAAKRAKKDKKKSSSSSSTNNNTTSSTTSSTPPVNTDTNITKWRTQNKIVLKDARNDIDGATITKSLATDPTYYPYQTFQDIQCIDRIHTKLIQQCTVVNGFDKPSPIQAQCWVRRKQFVYYIYSSIDFILYVYCFLNSNVYISHIISFFLLYCLLDDSCNHHIHSLFY